MFRYLFTAYDSENGEHSNQVDVAVTAENEGTALAKAAEGAKRDYYKTETVEEIPDLFESSESPEG